MSSDPFIIAPSGCPEFTSRRDLFTKKIAEQPLHGAMRPSRSSRLRNHIINGIESTIIHALPAIWPARNSS
jgi:hypothetical protein